MASYEDKQTKKYMEYYYAIYVGIGCILGTLCHALLHFAGGQHITPCFSLVCLRLYTHLSKCIDVIRTLLTEIKDRWF